MSRRLTGFRDENFVLLRTSDDIQPFPTVSRDVPLYPHPTTVTKIIAFVVQDP